MRRVRIGVRGISWTVGLAWMLVGLIGSPAMATSCAAHPDASPAAILAGEEQLAIDGAFADHYRGALLGTVTGVMTDEDSGSTSVRLDVLGTYGDVAADEAVIEMPDPGWMSGYAFEPDATYFVPVRHEPTPVMACEPITLVPAGDIDALVAQLDPPTEASRLSVGSTDIRTVALEDDDVFAEDRTGAGLAWFAMAALAVIVAGVIGVTALITRD